MTLNCSVSMSKRVRRQNRENVAFAMSELTRESPTDEWERIRPCLDQVLQELSERDREALLLRFFENCAFNEIGARLQLTESAAHKCVERALDRLRARLKCRGGTSSAAALTTMFASQAALAAPAGLATAITGTVLGTALPVAAAADGLTLGWIFRFPVGKHSSREQTVSFPSHKRFLWRTFTAEPPITN